MDTVNRLDCSTVLKLHTLAHVSRSEDVRAPIPGYSPLVLLYIYWNCLKVGQSSCQGSEIDVVVSEWMQRIPLKGRCA